MKIEKIKERISKFNYKILEPNISVLERLNNFNLSNVQKTILSNRLDEKDLEDEIQDLTLYINNYLNILSNINKIPDLDNASNLILRHIDKKSHIAIVTDLDCDGVNSAAMLYLAFVKIFMYRKTDLTVIVNKRRDGNGFNQTLMKKILSIDSQRHIDLLITADHGTANNDEFKILRGKNIDIVVTDHHLIPKDNYPDAANFLINNQRSDCGYYKSVSGCFMAFILVVNIYRKMFNNNTNFSQLNFLLPYVAITTISDVMSLKLPINRHIVKSGLLEMNSYRNKLWLAIKKQLGIVGSVTTKDIGFKIAPLINTANRTNSEELAYALLISETYQEALLHSTKLLELNTHRKTVQGITLRETIKDKLELDKYKHSIVTVIDTSLTINGIVAANIGEKHNLPTICFLDNKDLDYYTGSGRGINANLDLYTVLESIKNENSDLILKFGGHYGAAGVSIKKERLEEFKSVFDKKCKKILSKIDKQKTIDIDCVLQDKEITPYLLKPLEALSPYGKDWHEPIFMSILKPIKVIILGSFGAKIIFALKDGREVTGFNYFRTQHNYTLENIKNNLILGKQTYVCYKIQLENKDAIGMNIEIVSLAQDED